MRKPKRHRSQQPANRASGLVRSVEHGTETGAEALSAAPITGGEGAPVGPTIAQCPAVTPTMAGYYNQSHPDKQLRVLALDDSEPTLSWNVAVGMVCPDQALRDAIDGAIEKLRADGTIAKIYARYGVALQAPK